MPRINVHITASNHPLNGEVLSLDVTLELTFADLKAYINAETEIDPEKQQFFVDGRPLTGDTTTLQQAGIKDNDLLAVLVRDDGNAGQTGVGGASQASVAPQGSRLDQEAEAVRQQLLNNPRVLEQQPPQIRQAVRDRAQFRTIFEQAQRQMQQRESQMALMNEDPFDIDAQKRIEEAIRKQNVDENLEHALDHNPETFGVVNMLYIDVKVNSQPIKVLVDSGAQMTVMSPACAEQCNIMRLVDTRYSGIARGVGTAKILGRVHSADINIGGNHMACAFTVMEGKAVDLLLGLDMLKRYQVNIDLKRNKLVFPDFEVDFLPESEIPKMQEEERQSEPTVPGPNGTEIGTESGVIRPAGSIPKPGGSGKATATEDSRPKLGEAQPNFAPTAAASAAPGASSSGSSRHPQEKIDQLVGLGFSPEEAANALDACDGNVDAAASMMFS